MRIHDQHVDIARQAIEAARIKYTVGKVPQQDVLKAQLAMTRLEEHMIRFDRDAEVARNPMNTLLGRDPSTPIRVEGDFGGGRRSAGRQATGSSVATFHALICWKHRQQRRRAAKKKSLANKAFVPDFNIAGGYMLMPTGEQSPQQLHA